MNKFTKLLLPGLLAAIIFSTLSGCASDDATKVQYPVGIISSTELVSNHQSFSTAANNYQLSDSQQQQIATWPQDLRIDAYFGVWCHDSQREVPRMIKALSYQPKAKLSLYALDINKQDPLGLAKRDKIKYTPTFVIYLADKEIGRIVERPKVNLVADINQMLAASGRD